MKTFKYSMPSAIMVFLVTLFIFQGPGYPAGAQGSGASLQGKALYEAKCAICHGAGGKGDGPTAAKQPITPSDLTSPMFWKAKGPERTREAIDNGFGAMPPVEVSPEEASAIIDYMAKTFRRQGK